jgi:hypothetical protein
MHLMLILLAGSFIEHPDGATQRNKSPDPRTSSPAFLDSLLRPTSVSEVAISYPARRAAPATVKLAAFFSAQSRLFARRSRPSTRSASNTRPFVSEIPMPRPRGGFCFIHGIDAVSGDLRSVGQILFLSS